MKNAMVLLAVMGMMACQPDEGKINNLGSGGTVPVDSANKMLGSYLNSIGYGSNDTDLHSLSFDADMLRDYLNTPTGTTVTGIKIMMAHTLSYINSGKGNMNAGYRSGALTLLIAGYDENGDYVFIDQNVLNNAMPCPANCPPGDAGAPFLPTALNEQ